MTTGTQAIMTETTFGLVSPTQAMTTGTQAITTETTIGLVSPTQAMTTGTTTGLVSSKGRKKATMSKRAPGTVSSARLGLKRKITEKIEEIKIKKDKESTGYCCAICKELFVKRLDNRRCGRWVGCEKSEQCGTWVH